MNQQSHGVLQHQQSLPAAIGQPVMQQQSPMSSPPRNKFYPAPRLPSKKQRSQSLTPAQAIVVSNIKNAESGNSADGVLQSSGGGTADNAANGGSINHLNHSNGHSYRPDASRRFNQLEKSNSLCGSPNETQLHSHLENLNIHGKIPSNGFQTIARCTVGDVVDHHAKFTTHSLPRPTTNSFRGNLNRTSSLARDFTGDSSSNMFSSLEISKIPELPEKPPSPPPKPNRNNGGSISSLARPPKESVGLDQQYPLQRQGMAGIYQLSGSDSGNGSGDSMPGDMNEFIVHRGVVIKNPRFMSTSVSSATLKSLSEFDVQAAEDQLFTLQIPEYKPVRYSCQFPLGI